MMYKVTIFERYTQLNNKKERKRLFFLHIYIKIYTFAVQFWKIYTIRIIPLCKHSEWHAGVALFLYYPFQDIRMVRWTENISVAKNERKNALIQYSLLAYMHLLSYFGHLPWLYCYAHSPPNKANSPVATFARCSLYAHARIEKIGWHLYTIPFQTPIMSKLLLSFGRV